MKPYYYVYRHDGHPPSVKHESIADAEIEASRLADKHPGVTFEILMCIGVSRMTRSNTFWMNGVDPDLLV